MQKYQLRVLQPKGATLAADLARFFDAAMNGTGTVAVRTFPSGKYENHELVYLDLYPSSIEKGHVQ